MLSRSLNWASYLNRHSKIYACQRLAEEFSRGCKEVVSISFDYEVVAAIAIIEADAALLGAAAHGDL